MRAVANADNPWEAPDLIGIGSYPPDPTLLG
jgi:hypothetical protein